MATESGRVSRPVSLLLEGATPEREPLKFDIQLVGAPPEVEQLVNNIKQVAEDFLYHWKTFPIILPPSRFSSPGCRPFDILIAPSCDELDAAALDAGLEPHPLSPKQLHSIREKGEFEVPSRHFPGQTHVWRVAGWLQRGRIRAKEDLYCHIARAAALIVVVARDRLLKDEPLSVISGGKSLLLGIHRLLDLIIGMPSLAARDLDKKIREERARYLVAELICKEEQQQHVATLAAWVWRALRRAAAEKADPARSSPPPPVPTLYTTPSRLQIDLRLYRRELLRRAAPALQAALERESRGWFLHFREELAADLASRKVPPKDIEQELRAAGMREYVSRVGRAVRASSALRALGGGVPALLADQLRAAALLARAEDNVRHKLEASLATAEARIIAAHPILSRAPAWKKEKLAAAAKRLNSELRWAPLEDAAAAAQAHKLHQFRYFLLRDLAFLRDREPLLLKELRAAKTPTREFSWATRIWRPQKWEVVRHFRGRSERIPTVLTSRATSIVTPRSDPSQPVFLVHKDRVRSTATRWPGWRLLNTAHRCWCWSWNMMFVLAVVGAWWSPLSLRALICRSPFVPDYELSQVNGTLFPKRSSETHSMWSRLLLLWRHVSKERTRFETEPDTGLLGKGLSRAAHRAWTYGAVGALGSLALLLLLPAACGAAVALGLGLALAAPLVAPPAALLAHLANAAVYDFDAPRPSLNRWCVLFEVVIWRILILGILQPLAALFVALVLCPLAALVLLIGGVWWWCARYAWEWVAWRAVIRRAARVPAHDSAFAARVRGPGHSSKLYYQITAGQALAAVAARAERERVSASAAAAEALIERPLLDFRHFAAACFQPFSLQIAKTGAYKQLEKECSELKSSLREKVAARKRELALPLNDATRARVRMTAPDLKMAVRACARELSRVWGADAGAGAEEWWAARGLSPDDWPSLAANTLLEVFDAEVLVALESAEARLPLEAGSAARRWQQQAQDAAPPDLCPPGCAARWPPLHDGAEAPRAPRVSAPALDVAAFNPRAAPQPPLPHPATVALVLHNREADSPIPLESELCAEILRCVEDAAMDADDDRRVEAVERYRGGAEADSVDSSRSYDSDPEPATCRVSPQSERAACRWTLTGRGVRLRADLASPEDVTLDVERAHIVGTSV